MSQYGYGYVPPPGWQPPNAYPPLPSYSAPLYQPAEGTYPHYPDHGNAATEAYEQNRQTIPGLALNFQNSATHWQQPWMNGPSGPSGLPPPAKVNQPPNSESNTAGHELLLQAKPAAGGKDEDTTEEGELSEGELEDIYESRQQVSDYHGPGTPPFSTSRPGPKEVAGKQHPEETLTEKEAPAPYWGPDHATRERSGSYSPYLSPREIHSNGQGRSASDAIDTPRSELNQDTMDMTSTNEMLDTNGIGQPHVLVDTTSSDAVAEARKTAQDAILRLWPLNIRYQNYLEEGIDKELLDSLFADLGLDPAAAKVLPEQPISSPSTKVQGVPKETQHITSDEKDAGSSRNGLVEGEKVHDKSEERKDRIARLLAAKGSKPTAPVLPAAPPTSAPSAASAPSAPPAPVETRTETIAPELLTTAKAQGLTKSQSEKSKLIQQKMEALKKQREANKSVPPALATPTTEISLPQPATLPSVPSVNESTPGSGPSDLTIAAAAQAPTTLERTDSNGASIPGLFLSSTPQPSPVINERKRPVAADLNEYSDASTYKRPFGQNRQARPFLIDVSDDEDDAEMDLDSPDDEPTSIHRPSTPQRTTSFRDYPALPDNLPHRQLSSPKIVGTPTGYGSGIDLESMNKQIEDMKRKIAQAEARKKAKLSNNGTPSLPQSQAQSKEGSADTPSIPLPVSGAATVSRDETDDDARSTSLPSQVASQPSPQPASPAFLKLPKVRGDKRARRTPLRARIASERLPILEAHRKEQMQQLKHLQSEVIRIEQDIQDSLKEEERLREEVAGSESDQVAHDGSESEAAPAESQPALISTDATPESLAEPSNRASPNNQLNAAMDETSTTEVVDISTDFGTSGESADAINNRRLEKDPNEGVQARTASQPMTSVYEAVPSENDVLTPAGDIERQVDEANSDADSDSEPDANPNSDSDVLMDEAENSSSEADVESVDDYEPTEEGIELPDHETPADSAPSRPISPNEDAILETSDTDLQGVSATSPIVLPISTVEGDSEAPSESGREVEEALGHSDSHSDSGISKSTFVAYETPLHYFRAYRFHPEFKDSVTGGLRSLTYSNKIDVKREVCPDELLGGVCPRGNQCEYQHFENMKAPDDQILLQLGAYGNYEGDQQQEYISGLRDLLTEFKNRKIKDFQAISEGIIEYRAKFHGDKTRILPLGNVSL